MLAVLVVSGVVAEADLMDAAAGVRSVKKPPDNRVAYFWRCLRNRCPDVDLRGAMQRVRLPVAPTGSSEFDLAVAQLTQAWGAKL